MTETKEPLNVVATARLIVILINSKTPEPAALLRDAGISLNTLERAITLAKEVIKDVTNAATK